MRPDSVVASMPDPLGFLREVATELSFDILFEDLYDLSKPGKPSARPADSRSPPSPAPECRPAPASILDGSATAASLVILTIPRQIVCFGSGGNKSAARKAAVLNALLYLQTAAQAPFNDGMCEDAFVPFLFFSRLPQYLLLSNWFCVSLCDSLVLYYGHSFFRPFCV